MGLTIHYQLSVARKLPEEQVRELLERVAERARALGCADVGPVRSAFSEPVFAGLFVMAGRPQDGRFGHIPPRAGWVMEVWPGKGCESAHFGLCQYPRAVPCEWHGREEWVRTGYRRGWLFRGSCKTQYAAEFGWAHFLRCHTLVLELLRFWRQLGVTVQIQDEGGYWPHRSERRLRETLRLYDRLMAAVAGAFKDAAEASGTGFAVEAPILDRHDFEHLEAAGRATLAARARPSKAE